MNTNTYAGPADGDPAERALLEEFSHYLEAVSKAAAEPMIAAMHQQERQLRDCVEELDRRTAQQARLILVWTIPLLLLIAAEGGVVITLLTR